MPALVVLGLVVGGVRYCGDKVATAGEAEMLAVCSHVLVQLDPAPRIII